eukprot:symbB.v1.2.012929.t1/scaffold904.1/size155000/3
MPLSIISEHSVTFGPRKALEEKTYVPHVVCLDEPTNYLDTDTVELLKRAMRAFRGGFAVVSHNEKLIEEVCDEVLKAVDGLLLLAAKMKPKDHSQSIVALGTRHFWEEALQLLVQGKEVDLISFNAGISACVKVQEWDQAGISDPWSGCTPDQEDS